MAPPNEPPPQYAGADSYYAAGPPPPRYPYAYQPRAAAPPPPPRHPRVLWWLAVVRPWAIVVPFITVIMDIWWFSTGRLCGGSDSAGDECFWVLWLSLPLALASLVWNLAMTISTRRAANYRRGISTTIQLPVQTIIALGATVCLALMSWHYATYMDRIWDSHLEGAMIALLSIITTVNWLLAGFTAYEWNLDRKHYRQQETYVL